jgi:hypothetical protein
MAVNQFPLQIVTASSRGMTPSLLPFCELPSQTSTDKYSIVDKPLVDSISMNTHEKKVN